MNFAYEEGKCQAASDFGVRLASDTLHRGIPHGDMNVAAERLAKRLSTMEGLAPGLRDEKKNKLDRETHWGAPTSPWATSSPSYDYSGIGQDGAAI